MTPHITHIPLSGLKTTMQRDRRGPPCGLLRRVSSAVTAAMAVLVVLGCRAQTYALTCVGDLTPSDESTNTWTCGGSTAVNGTLIERLEGDLLVSSSSFTAVDLPKLRNCTGRVYVYNRCVSAQSQDLSRNT